MTEWQPDLLGPGFTCRRIDLGSDSEGPLVATLVRALPDPRSLWDRLLGRERLLEDVDVLYVHGWSDYFFQRRLARFWTERGARFFALDLRKYGRSLLEGQTPGYIEDLDDYDEEIDRALEIIDGEPPGGGTGSTGTSGASGGTGSGRALILLGHSTGGLVLSLWCARHPGRAEALVLNSPWLEFQLAGRVRHFVAQLVDVRARVRPYDAAPQLDFGYYHRAQQEVADPADPVEVNALWRPERSHAVTAGWLRAILAGHARIADGVEVGAPTCVLLSERSELSVRWNEDMTSCDTVIEVDAVARASLGIGRSVTVERIDGAIHDIFLSRPAVRDEAYDRMGRWVAGWAAQRR